MVTKLIINVVSARTVRPRRERLMDLMEFEIQMHPYTHTAAFWTLSNTQPSGGRLCGALEVVLVQLRH